MRTSYRPHGVPPASRHRRRHGVPSRTRLRSSCPIIPVLGSLFADIGKVRSAPIRRDLKLGVDFVFPVPAVLLLEIALQRMVSFSQTPIT